jgi:REP element-mobilizing transposase RayT
MGARFAKGEFYHIYNRGVEQRPIFMDQRDYERFLISLCVFNSDKPVVIRELPENPEMRSLGEPLTSVVSYVLMKNHVHFLVRCIEEKNLSEFLRKVFIGYSMYFNTRHQRSGVLFQGRSKSKHITSDVYLKHLVNYIHLNPLDYHLPEWRMGEVKNTQRLKKITYEYPWSSLADFLGKKYDRVLDHKLINELFPNKEELMRQMEEWSSSVYNENRGTFLE